MNEIASQRPGGFPDGFEIVQQLHGAGVFGEMFEVRDRRTSESDPVTRTVRFFSETDPQWRDKLLEHAQRLLPLELPYVSLPLEAGQTAAGGVFVVGQHLGPVVSTSVSRHQGLAAEDWDRVAENLLEGLANLHKYEIPHGDVRPQNAYFEPDCAARPSVWLADAVIGPLPWWSSGAMRDAESRYYRPPEWEDRYSPQPTKKADLYALGLTLIECILGTAANPLHDTQPVDLADAGRRLKQKGASAPLQRVIHRMLAPEAERPGDAGEVLALYRKAPVSTTALRSWQGASAAVALMLVAVVGYSMFGDPKSVLNDRITHLEKEVAGVNTDLKGLKSKLKEKNSEYNKLLTTLELPENTLTDMLVEAKEDIKKLKYDLRVARGEVPDSVRLVRKQWTSEIALVVAIKESAQLTMDDLDGVSASILDNDDYKEHFSAWDQAYDEWKAQDLDQWVRHARNDQGEIAEGREEIQKLLARLATSAEEPWSAEKRDAVTKYLKTLNRAREAWDDFAESDQSLTKASDYFDGEAVGVPEVKGICLGWRNEFKKRKNWRLRLKKGYVKAAKDTDRYVTITTDVGGYEDSESNIKGWHEWDKPTTHEYNRGDVWQFNWKAGTSIIVQLTHKQAWSGINFDFIDQKKFGPVAVYRLHKQGRVGVAKSYLTLEVVDCPGPPLKQEAVDAVPESVKQILNP